MPQRKLWDDKRFHSLNYELKKQYGHTLYKISLNGGMTCPNRDGNLDTRGCIFCSEGGSGDFCPSVSKTIKEQIAEEIERLKVSKYQGDQFIAYFQAFTNTYAPVSYLREIFMEAINHPNIAILSIATRPDCLPEEVLTLLNELNNIKPVWIELGLQTIHESSADFIRRGYDLSCFDKAVYELSKRNITIIVHLILGLPFETREDMIETIDYVVKLPIQGLKLQLLHILRNTDLVNYMDKFHILSFEEYVELICACIERIPESIVIHRITGDGPKDLLLAPTWSLKKKQVLNAISHALKEKNIWQGKRYQEV